jgi:transposase
MFGGCIGRTFGGPECNPKPEPLDNATALCSTLVAMPPDDHACFFREEAARLRADLERVQGELAAIKQRLFGKKSEKMPPMSREVRRGRNADPAETQRKRREAALAKEKLVTEHVAVPVPEAQRCCPRCERRDLRPVGQGKPTTIYDYVPGYFRRRLVLRETLACPCGQFIVTAPCPDKSTDKTRYDVGFIAHLIVAKCADAIPLYRLETQYRRLGIPIARSTMTDLFHRNAELLSPLVQRLLARIAASDLVQADETSLRMLGTTKRAYLWTFLAGNDIGYVFSIDRSGQTPREVLGASTGTLVVDAYTGYNKVTEVGGRTRAGCLAHARRKLFEASIGAPEAMTALELIRQVYMIEHEAKEKGVVGTDAHLTLRRTRSRPLMARLLSWGRSQRGLHPPKSTMGRAVAYLLKNHRPLTRFLSNARIPPDNNRSEAALRVVALGRKNFLFVGHEDAGDNIAGLYSLVATCNAYGVNPVDYLRDVLVRISSHPQARIDELLPDRWQPASS